MRIGLAQTRFPGSLTEGMTVVRQYLQQASAASCEVVCFPESILPGLRGVGFQVEPYDHERMKASLEQVRSWAQEAGIAVILPMEWRDEQGLHIAAFVISSDGQVQGCQTKNQIDPDEDVHGYVPGSGRQIFEVNGVPFGIVICHEGWRYPETVRWAACQGAAIVFHPQFTGREGLPEFYKGAMVCRSMENQIYFASVNYALEGQQVTTSLIAPTGERLAEAHGGVEELLVQDIDPNLAHRLLAKRFKPQLLVHV